MQKKATKRAWWTDSIIPALTTVKQIVTFFGLRVVAGNDFTGKLGKPSEVWVARSGGRQNWRLLTPPIDFFVIFVNQAFDPPQRVANILILERLNDEILSPGRERLFSGKLAAGARDQNYRQVRMVSFYLNQEFQTIHQRHQDI